jgi:cellulose biosynthesis protein BcsQ
VRVFLATYHQQINSIVEKLETEKGIRELEKTLQAEGLSRWAKPVLIVGEVFYRERVIEKARPSKPHLVIIYDKLPGLIEMGVLLEEIRLEVKDPQGNDSRVLFLTSLEQGSPLLRKAVEIGIWDIISGGDIHPLRLLECIYYPANYSSAARYRLAPVDKSRIKPIFHSSDKESADTVPVVKRTPEPKIIEKKEYIRIGRVKIKETILIWSPFEAGKTFLAVNLSLAVARLGIKTILMDADLEQSTMEYHFNVKEEQKYLLLQAIKHRLKVQEYLEKSLSYGKNMRVLTLPSFGIEKPEITPEECFSLYDQLANNCEVLIIDGAKDYSSPLTRVALTVASRVLLVVTLAPERAKMTRTVLNQLKSKGINTKKIEPVINMWTKIPRPSKKDIAHILNIKHLFSPEIPLIAEAVLQSVFDGCPVYESPFAPAHFVWSIETLAKEVTGVDTIINQGESRRNFWGWLRRRKSGLLRQDFS